MISIINFSTTLSMIAVDSPKTATIISVVSHKEAYATTNFFA